MKLKLVFIAALSTGCMLSQVPESTRIGKHHLAESIQEWLTASSFASLTEACVARQKEARQSCESINASVMSAMGGNSNAIAESFNQTCIREENQAAQECEIEAGKIDAGLKGSMSSVSSDRLQEWEFANKKLGSLTITIPARPLYIQDADTAKELGFLRDAYGEPTAVESVTFQNSYGAKWECPKVRWSMPDGTVILLSEHMRNTSAGPRKGDIILFISAETLKTSTPTTPNPYK
jgi:hypothetical protein